jgi:hypothetical protein
MIDETMSLARVGIDLGRSTSKVQSPATVPQLQPPGWHIVGNNRSRDYGDAQAVRMFLDYRFQRVQILLSFMHVGEK